MKEVQDVHTRLLKCTLEPEDSRAYWAHTDGSTAVDAKSAFERFLFGERSLRRVKVLLTNLRARYDAFPPALRVLHRWRPSVETRLLVCHWHVQLTDPLYRAFSGEFLLERRERGRHDVTRDVVMAWVETQGPGRWTAGTRTQFASKLLSAAHGAGLVASKRDPRPLSFPSVPDEALEYLLYLLRAVEHTGSTLRNPYLRSVGLEGELLYERLRALPALRFRRQGELLDPGWRYPGLEAWAAQRADVFPAERAS